MTSLAELRKKLMADKERKEKGGSFQVDNSIYPFREIPNASTATFRFLPDADPENFYFWVTKQTINLPFSGVIGGDTNKKVDVQVPCMHMYGESCYITDTIKPLWKDEDTKQIARQYWRSNSYIYQGFVVESPFAEENPPENPIRRLIFRQSVHDAIRSQIEDPDSFLEHMPTDYVNGYDFKVHKVKKGEFFSYAGSKWLPKTRALSDAEMAAIDQYGLSKLTDFLPKKPGAEELNAISEMFEASYNGELYDPARWGNFYKPWGLELPTNNRTVSSVKAVPHKEETINVPEVNDDDDEDVVSKPSETKAPVDANNAVNAVLSRIKARQSASQ